MHALDVADDIVERVIRDYPVLDVIVGKEAVSVGNRYPSVYLEQREPAVRRIGEFRK